MQEVQLDKHVKLLDSPGIVMAKDKDYSAAILRNSVRVSSVSVVCVYGGGGGGGVATPSHGSPGQRIITAKRRQTRTHRVWSHQEYSTNAHF